MTATPLAAALVLVALGAVAFLSRKRRPGPSGVVLEARLPLGRDAGVALVRAGGERLLLGWGTGGVRVLSRLRREGSP